MPRMRTIGTAYKELIKHDPNTAMTQNGLRTLVLRGTIPSIRVGQKRLISMDVLEKFLEGKHE